MIDMTTTTIVYFRNSNI